MDIISVFLIAIGLASDAFAVSMTNGMLVKNLKLKQAVNFGYYFGTAQFVMTMLGYYFGTRFSAYIVSIDHWLAFGLLVLIGGKMLFETFKNQNNIPNTADIFSYKNMMILAVATSIDALAVGISFAFINVDIFIPSLLIGLVAFAMSTAGAMLGKKLGVLFKIYAERIGGVILICIGIKILFEHLSV